MAGLALPYSGTYNPSVQGGAGSTGSATLTGYGVSTTASYGTNVTYAAPGPTKHHETFRQNATWVAGTDPQNNVAVANTLYSDVT